MHLYGFHNYLVATDCAVLSILRQHINRAFFRLDVDHRSRSPTLCSALYLAYRHSGTAVTTSRPAAFALKFSTANPAIAPRVECVALPMCGVNTTCGSARNRSGTCGSSANTSSAAPPSAPDSSASISAVSSTTDPRATFTSNPCGPSAASTSALMRCRVAAPPGVMTTSTSLRAARSTSDAMCG